MLACGSQTLANLVLDTTIAAFDAEKGTTMGRKSSILHDGWRANLAIWAGFVVMFTALHYGANYVFGWHLITTWWKVIALYAIIGAIMWAGAAIAEGRSKTWDD